MNICFYTSALPVPELGGVERVTYNLCTEFRKAGHNVFNLISTGKNHTFVIPEADNQEAKADYVNTFLKDNNIEILIDQYGNLPFLRHPFISSEVKIVSCFHTDPFHKHLFRGLVETFSFKELKYGLMNIVFAINIPRSLYRERKSVYEVTKNRGVDKYVFLSKSYIPPYSNSSPAMKSMFAAIPNAVDSKISQMAEQTPILTNKNKKKIIWCGRIVHNQKNILFLPRLWRQLERMHPDWELIIVGDGVDRPLLERRIKKYKLRNVSITGYTDPYPYYQLADIFVLPSFSEGFGMVLIEAMAFGCVPVVFDSAKVFRDIIDNESDGFIIPDMNEKAYIKACDKLMTDSEYRQVLQKKAMEKSKNFSIDKVCAIWMNLFNEVLDGK